MATHMMAPAGTRGEAVIEGHTYKIPKDGIIKIAQDNHYETLKRHGFMDHHVEDENVLEKIENMGEAELVEFIEERGGDADGLSEKKLRKLAKELAEG